MLNHLKIYPHTLLGHSFGGKVAMSMVHQFGKQLPRPVQVWVLDTVPGDVWCEAGDHPRDTINFARTIPMPIATRRDLVDCLTGAGFTLEVGAARSLARSLLRSLFLSLPRAVPA